MGDFLSVIIPTYNHRPVLEKTLRSLEEQEYPISHWELVLVNDGSGDDTHEFIQSTQFRFYLTYINHDRNHGRARSRNDGVHRARGEFIVFLDDDMEAEPALLASYADFYTKHSNTVVIGNIQWDRAENPTGFHQYYGSRGVHKLTTGKTVPYKYFVTGNSSLPKEFFLSAGGFCEEIESWGGEDLLLGYKLNTMGCTFQFLNEAVAHHQTETFLVETLDRMVKFGRYSVPCLLEQAPELNYILRLHLAFERLLKGSLKEVIKKIIIRTSLIRPLYYIMKKLAVLLKNNRLPDMYYDYLIFAATVLGYKKANVVEDA